MITRRSWTSSAVGLGLLALALPAPPAAAGIFGRKRAPESVEEQAPKAPPPPEPAAPPFTAPLPVDHGGAPEGLSHAGARACNACHYGAFDGWATSTHAVGFLSDAFRQAVADVGSPACTVCHLPLQDQHAWTWTFDGGAPSRPVTAPKPGFDATLAGEGVTCAACHVRDGQVLASGPPQADAASAHPVGWTPILGQSEVCATCHQLTWPGSDRPFYDTFGEWTRSPHAEAGISCQDCHMGAGAGERLGSDHSFQAARGRGASLLVELPSDLLVRGEEALEGRLRIQNTGAGHALPTGSPFKGLRLEAWLQGPEDARVTVLEADLARVLEDAPPWRTTSDTRLAPGEERSYGLHLALDHGQPAGEWTLRIALRKVVRGEVGDTPMAQQIVALRVE